MLPEETAPKQYDWTTAVKRKCFFRGTPPSSSTARGTRAAILGEAGDEQQPQADDMMMGFDGDASGLPAATASGGGGVGVTGGGSGGGIGGGADGHRSTRRRGGPGAHRADRIARRMAEASSAVGAGGWPATS